jgi:hypothetical protein
MTKFHCRHPEEWPSGRVSKDAPALAPRRDRAGSNAKTAAAQRFFLVATPAFDLPLGSRRR